MGVSFSSSQSKISFLHGKLLVAGLLLFLGLVFGFFFITEERIQFNDEAVANGGTRILHHGKVQEGYNLYVTKGVEKGFAHLIDLEGNIIHSWRLLPTKENYHQITPRPDGSLHITVEQTPSQPIDHLILDSDSNVLKTIKVDGLNAHHDTEWFDNGGSLGLFLDVRVINHKGKDITLIDDVLVLLSSEGEVLKSIKLSDLFINDELFVDKLDRAYEHSLHPNSDMDFDILIKGRQVYGYDFFHSNSIELIKEDIPGVAKKGDWMVSVRNFDRVIIVDPDMEKIVWEWGEGMVSKPHYATIIGAGRMMYFDNGRDSKSTRVLEVDMPSKSIAWQYGQNESESFFSSIMGGAQRLENGNTLITQSTAGRVFEITPDREIVWEWYSPNFAVREDKSLKSPQSSLGMPYRMHRIPKDFFIGFDFNYGRVH